MSDIKMLDPIVKKYKISLQSWLHIWWSDWWLKIWWIDSQVVKNPLSWEPYIPWSSIKWKMRASLEMIKWDYTGKFLPSQDIDNISNIAKSFWTSFTKKENDKKEQVNIASRLIFSDFEMTKTYKNKFDELWSVDFMEDKSENTVPRFLKWNANPRHIERVPAWVEFEWTITLTPVEWENWITKEELEKILEEWIKYLEHFWLWWWVSRWNWKIKITEI